MSSLARFMKLNKKVKENVMYAVTKSLCDENGEPLEWEIKHITTKQDANLRDECTYEVPVVGKLHAFREKIDLNKYIAKLLTASVVFPDLMNAELQDSYGVKTPEDLLKEMVDNPGEYADFSLFVQKTNGFNVTIEEKNDKAKN